MYMSSPCHFIYWMGLVIACTRCESITRLKQDKMHWRQETEHPEVKFLRFKNLQLRISFYRHFHQTVIKRNNIILSFGHTRIPQNLIMGFTSSYNPENCVKSGQQCWRKTVRHINYCSPLVSGQLQCRLISPTQRDSFLQ